MRHVEQRLGSHEIPVRKRTGQDQRAERDHLEGGLPLRQPADRHRDLQPAEKFAQARHRDLAHQDYQPRDDMEIAHQWSAQPPLGGQHENHRGDHDLVGDRIEEDAQPAHRTARAREIAIEVIGDPHQAVEREGEGIAQLPVGPPQQEGQQWYRDDARQSQKIGQRQHRPPPSAGLGRAKALLYPLSAPGGALGASDLS